MNVASTVLRNIASNWGGLVLNLAITFFLSPFVVNSLGAAYFGIWALTMQFTGYMYILDFGVRDSVIRYTARYRGLGQAAKLNRLLTTSLAIYVPIAVLATIVTGLAVVWFPRWFQIDPRYATEARIAVGFVGLTIAQGFVFNAFTGVLQGLQRFDIANNIGVLGNVARTGLVVLSIKSGWGLIGLSAIQFGLSLLGSLATTWYALRLLEAEGLAFVPTWTRGRRGAALTRRIFGYSAYVFVNNVGQKIILASDAVVVARFLPVASVTYFAIAGNLVNLLRAVVVASVWVLMPLASHYASKRMNHEIRILLVRASKGALLVALPLCTGYILLGRQFIDLWMGGDFGGRAAEVLLVLAIAEVFSAPHHAMSAVLMGMNHHKPMALLRIAEAAGNLFLSIVLVQKMGLVGVAWGTTIPHLFVMIGVLPVLTCRAVGLSMWDYAKGAYLRAFAATVPFVLSVAAMAKWWPPTSLVGFFAAMTGLLLPYLATVYLVALTSEERAMAKQEIAARLPGRRRVPAEPVTDGGKG